MKTPGPNKLLNRAVQSAMLAGLFTVPTAWAAPWNLVHQPLNLTSKVPANVLLIVDDSGSMDWEIMSKDLTNNGLFTGTQPDGSNPAKSGSIKNRDLDGNGEADCVVGTNQSFYGYLYGVEAQANLWKKECDTVDDREWRFRNSDYNPFYFDPLKTYFPWAGVNADGVTPFGNMSATSALSNPWTGWRSGKGGNEVFDLTKYHTTGMRYYTWADANSNGLFDDGEETEYLVASQPAAVQQNFANWFTYSRSRHLIAKSAYGRLIANMNGLRVGLATLWNNGKVNTPLSQIDSTPAGEANRKNLLEHLYQIDPAGGTPLQNTLKQAGEYLSGHASNTLFPGNTAAPLTDAQGGSCQQNFTLLMTDGFYNNSSDYNDKTPSATIGNADGDASSKFDSKVDKKPFPNYGDNVKRSLADIAMYYYENDIIPSAANNVPTMQGVDEAPHQHMVTFTIAFGVSGNLLGTPERYQENLAWGSWPGWPTVTSGKTADDFSNTQKIDDLRHAAYNGRGEFLEANDPDSLISSLTQALNSIQGRSGSSSAAAFNASALQKNTLLFRAGYDARDWSGRLLYEPVSVAPAGVFGAAIADAGSILTKTDPNLRTILTIDPATNVGVPFRMTDLNTTQQTAIGSQEVLDYLRGEQGCEINYSGPRTCKTAKNLRTRSSTLGDIINSTPVYVDAPNGGYVSDPAYVQFLKDQAARTPVIYVGANDGMLHGFDASVDSNGKATANTAKELLAYVPGVVYKELAGLSGITYAHRSFVDATPVAGDVKFADGSWHSVLLGGLRNGGQAVYALDITDPQKFAEKNAKDVVLWEFTDNGTGASGDKGDADLGYTYGEPAIAKMANGEWAAVFGNGYNNTATDANTSTTGDAVLYVVNIQTGALIAKLSTKTGMSADPEKLGHPNGLSGVRVADVDADGVADFAYAGDLFGNLWRFDLTSTVPAEWSVSFGSKPLFTATSVEGKMQSITVRPVWGAPQQGLDKGYMLYFGTGKYLENSDNSALGQPTQSFYALWDKWPKKSADAFAAGTRATLQQQIILEEQPKGFRITSDTPVDWLTQQGWYMDLTVKGAVSNNGERVIHDALLSNGQILFSTFMPSTAICDASGSGFVMIIEALSGGRPPLPPLNITADKSIDAKDLVDAASVGKKVAVTGYKSFRGIPSSPVFIEGSDGTESHIAVGSSNGTVSGPPWLEDVEPIPRTSLVSTGVVKGRVTWKRLK